MSPEKQRIAIAEACGWERTPEYDFSTAHGRIEVWGRGLQLAQNLPDYLTDLNAMHEAEKVLTPEQFIEYGDHLRLVSNTAGIRNTILRRQVSATAAQRAEAFLRTIGKWEDSK